MFSTEDTESKEGAGGGNGNGAIMHLGRACYNVALGSLSCKCLHSLWLCNHSSRGCILQPAIVVYVWVMGLLKAHVMIDRAGTFHQQIWVAVSHSGSFP